MVKAQVELSDEQAELARRMAAARGISIDEVIRESLEAYLHPSPRASTRKLRQRALEAIGAFSGPTDLARRHDDYLEEAGRE